MSTIHFHQSTTSTLEQSIAGLTDFGPGRSKLFGNSADEYLKVHHRGQNEADVTDGSNGIWERLHYDWSDPNHVVFSMTDSNVWGGASGHTYTFTRRPNGTTDVDVVVVARGRTSRDDCSASCSGLSARGVLGVCEQHQGHRSLERKRKRIMSNQRTRTDEADRTPASKGGICAATRLATRATRRQCARNSGLRRLPRR